MTLASTTNHDSKPDEYEPIDLLAKTNANKLIQVDRIDEVIDYLNDLKIQVYYADMDASKFVEVIPDSSYLRGTDIRALHLYDGNIDLLVEREGGLEAASYAIPVIMKIDYKVVLDWHPDLSLNKNHGVNEITEDISNILSGK